MIEYALKTEEKSAKGAKSSIRCSNEDFPLYSRDCLKQCPKCMCESDFYHYDRSCYLGIVKQPCYFSEELHRVFCNIILFKPEGDTFV